MDEESHHTINVDGHRRRTVHATQRRAAQAREKFASSLDGDLRRRSSDSGSSSCSMQKLSETSHNDLKKKKKKNKMHARPYNIIPLDPDSASNQAIAQIPEIQAVIHALGDTRGLPWPDGHAKKSDEDLLDWLKVTFGFQEDNVSNQREHVVMLLANVQMRQIPRTAEESDQLDERAVEEITKKLFDNYTKWCKFLNRESNIQFPTAKEEVQQRRLLYIGLYLLIWGEAANLRFMPECLCYIFHHMAFELSTMLLGNVVGKIIKPAYGGKKEAFLNEVITPIYKVIAQETERSKTEKSKHFRWRNYDDLNEYFWEEKCFFLGWPMRTDADFFCDILVHQTKDTANQKSSRDRWIGKINFVEVRSFWHIFRSFSRMWIFFIVCLQAMIIIAWNDDFPGHAFNTKVLKKFSAIFISASVLHTWQALLDIILGWKARRNMSFHVKLRYTLKFILATTWMFVLLITYFYTWRNPTGIGTAMADNLGDQQSQSLIYILSVIIYMSPNILDTLLFLFPCLRHYLERSNYKIIALMFWWWQPHHFLGREIRESSFSLFKYTTFWVLLIATKLAFSYHVEIEPLVRLTKDIMKETTITFQWHELSLQDIKNIGVVTALWIPNTLVYFVDTQIWYAIFSTFFGGINGACYRLGEIRSLGMLRSRFQSLPGSFNARLFPLEKRKMKVFPKIQETGPSIDKMAAARFAQTWNIIITSFREEDLISNRERDLLLAPYYVDPDLDLIQWPPFLIANKIPAAIGMVKDSNKNYDELKKRIQTDYYMLCAIQECYALSKNIIEKLIIGHLERQVIKDKISKIDEHVAKGTLINEVNINCVPVLYSKFIDLIQLLLHNKQEERDQLVTIIQEILEAATMNLLEQEQLSFLDSGHRESFARQENIKPSDLKVQLLAQAGAVRFPLPESDALSEMIKRLNLLLTLTESTVNVPSNLEARRRLSFFANSLFMNIPDAPQTQDALSFSVLTPYYKEDVIYSLQGLEMPNEDGVSILLYLQRIYPDEWANFLERIGCKIEVLYGDRILEEELCLWASYRGQTLIRTVKGMMYYRKALEFQAFLDMADNEDLMEGCGMVEQSSKEQSQEKRSMWAKCQAIADMKFTYVLSCQLYGSQKRSSDPRAQDILRLIKSYPSLRLAYIDEVEELNNSTGAKLKKVYYSTLVKAVSAEDSADPMKNLDQVIYRIKLPGPAIIGEGKPENQNHAIIFTRGEGLQAIDMNQEHYMEEALKMRNLLQEFVKKHDNDKYPSILGVREHIFTGSVSSLAWFISSQETSFVTIGQRILADPLKVRFHYGHPDIFDKIFHLTRGGISKASKIINLSEDIFAGFSSTLRGGNITHHEYVQVGKGRDVGLKQISLFEAKIASGNGEQTLSRDVYRLGQQFDFFRMLSFYFTTVGFYFNTLITVLTVFAFLYGHLYLFSGGFAEASGFRRELIHSQPLQVALTSQSCMQLGFLMALPMMMEISLERGFRAALTEFILMQMQLSSVFFTFSVGTKSHHYGRVLLHGGAEYRATGRGFGVFHVKFAENYRLYSRSHFVKAIEVMALLMVYEIFAYTYRKTIASIFLIVSMWFMVGTWLFAPFLFNPSGFEWQKIVHDWTDWKMWVGNHGGIGVPPEKSWESWWENEQEHLRHTGKCGIIAELSLALRFLIYHYALVCHTTTHRKSRLVYGATWLSLFGILLFAKVMSAGKGRFNSKLQIVLQFIKGLMFVTVVFIMVILTTILGITALDIVFCFLALIPTGWGLLLIAQACRPLVVDAGLWGSVKEIARLYEILMGLFLFAPVAFLAWFPFVSKLQTRMLFDQAFSRGLQISHVIGGKKK